MWLCAWVYACVTSEGECEARTGRWLFSSVTLWLMSPRQGLSLNQSLLVLASLAGHAVLLPPSLPCSAEGSDLRGLAFL